MKKLIIILTFLATSASAQIDTIPDSNSQPFYGTRHIVNMNGTDTMAFYQPGDTAHIMANDSIYIHKLLNTGSGGDGTPGGTDREIQINNNGSFGTAGISIPSDYNMYFDRYAIVENQSEDILQVGHNFTGKVFHFDQSFPPYFGVGDIHTGSNNVMFSATNAGADTTYISVGNIDFSFNDNDDLRLGINQDGGNVSAEMHFAAEHLLKIKQDSADYLRFYDDTLDIDKYARFNSGSNIEGGSTPTLQEVTETGNTTSEKIGIGGGMSSSNFNSNFDLHVLGSESGNVLIDGNGNNLIINSYGDNLANKNINKIFTGNPDGDISIDVGSTGEGIYIDQSSDVFQGVGIGTTSPSTKLEVIGNVTADNFVLNSDRRLKSNINPLQDALIKALFLNPISFTYNENGRESIGFTAQNVQKIFPELVHKGNDGYLKLSYDQITAVNNAAIHKLYSEIQEVKKENQRLKSEIQELKNKMENICEQLKE